MAWEWSHTPEAYEAAYQNLLQLDFATLRTIWAEWQACDHPDDDAQTFDETKYDTAIHNAGKIHTEALANDIWTNASEQATCDNGGFNAWLCPFGCGCHTVSFDRKESET